jgi:hypothetical protein
MVQETLARHKTEPTKRIILGLGEGIFYFDAWPLLQPG